MNTLAATATLLLLGTAAVVGASPSPAATDALPDTTAADTGSEGHGATIASTLILGGPPECPERPFCLPGLESVYGLSFAEFRPLDAGGPITVEALRSGQVDVGLLFTSDPSIVSNGFVLLEDDRQLQLADNLIPVVRTEVLEVSPGIGDLLGTVTAKLSQDELTNLNKSVTLDLVDPAEAAAAWLTVNGLLPGAGDAGQPKVTVGSTNFYEQEILGELFAQVLEANGFEVERKFQLGNREIVFPALESGQLDILAEYAATALEFANGGAGEASTDPLATAARLRERLADKGLTVLEPAEATDQNGFVVTAETAARYELSSISDLAEPLP
jgi:osmoprotectant transport system substrate-binding protein